MADNDARTGNDTTTNAGQGDVQTPQGDGIDWKAEARKWERRAKENADAARRLAEAEDASKSDIEKLSERAAAAEKRAEEAERRALRMEVAQAKGLTPAQAKRLTGSTREELEADADDLLEAFGAKKDEPKEGDGDEGEAKPDESAGAAIFGRPKERLTPGAAPDHEPEKTPDQLADEVLKKARGL